MDLRGANLRDADLRGANLHGVRNLTKEQLSMAIIDENASIDAGAVAEMAADPAVQTEGAAIARDFAATEADGIEGD